MENDPRSAGYDRRAEDLPPGDSPVGTRAGSGMDMADATDREERENLGNDEWLIAKAREIFTSSTDYLQTNITTKWEQNVSHFHSTHAPGTPYTREGYRRSKQFRPETRIMVKQSEAAMANAAFTTVDAVTVTPQNPKIPMQAVAAAVQKEILQYRLEYRMPWFLTVMGAFQSTKVYGLCISHQYWNYIEDTDLVPALDENGQLIVEEDENGRMTPMGREERRVRADELVCDLIEPENFRFDPMCDWRDPARSSPYLILLRPMYVADAMEMMEKVDPKTGAPAWNKHSASEILATRKEDFDRTRQARAGRNRIDPAENQANQDYTTVWAHFNVVRVDGEDFGYWTMGTELLLTEPMRLRDMYPWLREGERPFVVGFSTIEAFRTYPSGDVEQSAPMQREINDLANLRHDNIKLALNKRFYIRRGSQVDLDALMRNTPGGGVMMNDTERDVKTVDTRDVTGSSYQEHGMLASEFERLTGGFNAGQAAGQSAGVGQMSMAGSSAGAVQDYSIKIFVESWMEPVLRQLSRLIQHYETDEVILAIAADKADLLDKFNEDEVTDEMLRQELVVRVNVGMGNTDPMRKVERLTFGLERAINLPGVAERVKGMAVANEIMGTLGYRDAERFFMTDEEMEQLPPPPPDPMIEIEMRKIANNEKDTEYRNQRELQKMQSEMELRMMEIAAKQELTMAELETRLGMKIEEISSMRDANALNALIKREEMRLKDSTGEGI